MPDDPAHDGPSGVVRHAAARGRDLTTLELARAIATAVLRVGPTRHRDSTRDAPTQIVLRTLEQTDHWFMRVRTDADGSILSSRPIKRHT